MKKYTKSAFTLVELIVVITILAILATIAILNLLGQTDKARNVRVTSDVVSLSSKVNLLVLKNKNIVKDFLSSPTLTSTNKVNGVGAGINLNPGNNYDVSTINFYKLEENEEKFRNKFKNSNGDEVEESYLIGYAAKDNRSVFNIAGQIKNTEGNFVAVINGNYFKADIGDVDSLISARGAGDTTPLIDGFVTNSIY